MKLVDKRMAETKFRGGISSAGHRVIAPKQLLHRSSAHNSMWPGEMTEIAHL